VHHVRPAMATLFEVVLIGEDEEHLGAVAEAALDEISRVERLLSRHDPQSEVSRVNREAIRGEVIVDRELFELIGRCAEAMSRTDGYFDIAVQKCEPPADRREMISVTVDNQKRTMRFYREDVSLDFGALGKGYALDRAAEIVRSFGVDRALLHGGTSSILALGNGPNEKPWRIGIRNPTAADDAVEIAQISLIDRGYSCSAVFSADQTVSDIVDPHSGVPLAEQAACVVIASTALDAEMLSTALLAMGMARARAYTEKVAPGVSVGWIAGTSAPSIEWFGATPGI
jgi:thiamine biosynthesis lipoprotein